MISTSELGSGCQGRHGDVFITFSTRGELKKRDKVLLRSIPIHGVKWWSGKNVEDVVTSSESDLKRRTFSLIKLSSFFFFFYISNDDVLFFSSSSFSYFWYSWYPMIESQSSDNAISAFMRRTGWYAGSYQGLFFRVIPDDSDIRWEIIIRLMAGYMAVWTSQSGWIQKSCCYYKRSP